MNALILCVTRVDPLTLSEDDWPRYWNYVQYYLEVVHQVEFK